MQIGVAGVADGKSSKNSAAGRKSSHVQITSVVITIGNSDKRSRGSDLDWLVLSGSSCLESRTFTKNQKRQ